MKDSNDTTPGVQSGRRGRLGPSPNPASALRSSPPEGAAMADSSFDVVSKVDKQEVSNALNQAE
ncbi:MAG TPA: DUF520 family protein, partial [Acidimicrobiales bacterium]|nr:DUF520 family protein [Acidimicrobiales bacterium]